MPQRFAILLFATFMIVGCLALPVGAQSVRRASAPAAQWTDLVSFVRDSVYHLILEPAEVKPDEVSMEAETDQFAVHGYPDAVTVHVWTRAGSGVPVAGFVSREVAKVVFALREGRLVGVSVSGELVGDCRQSTNVDRSLARTKATLAAVRAVFPFVSVKEVTGKRGEALLPHGWSHVAR